MEHARHLTWNDLLLYGGSRARRRDRTLCWGIPASDVFDAVHRHVLQCLGVARAVRDSQRSETEMELLKKSATRSVEEIFNRIWEAMRQMMKDAKDAPRPTCASCPDPAACARLRPYGTNEAT